MSTTNRYYWVVTSGCTETSNWFTGSHKFTATTKPSDYTENSWKSGGTGIRYQIKHVYSYPNGQTKTINVTAPTSVTLGYKDTTSNVNYQYYVTVVDGTKTDWYSAGNHTFTSNTKPSDYTENSWSGQTAEVTGNIRYHKRHTYAYKNGQTKTVNITGPTTVTMGYTDTVSEVDKQQYKSGDSTLVVSHASHRTDNDGGNFPNETLTYYINCYHGDDYAFTSDDDIEDIYFYDNHGNKLYLVRDGNYSPDVTIVVWSERDGIENDDGWHVYRQIKWVGNAGSYKGIYSSPRHHEFGDPWYAYWAYRDNPGYWQAI